MGGVFLDFRTGDQRRNGRMALEGFEQLRRRGLVFREVGNEAADADRDAFLVGVDEAHAGHAIGNGAGGFDHRAFVRLELNRASMVSAGRKCISLTARATCAAAGRGRNSARVPSRPLTPSASTTTSAWIGAARTVGAHADHLAIGVVDQFDDGGLAQQDRALRLRPPGEPAVELRADDGVAVGLFLVEVVVPVMHAGMGGVGHQPEALFDQMALQRRLDAEIRDDLFHHVRIENAALDVFRARIFAALQLQHFQATRGHGVGGGVAGHAGADDDRVKFFVDHCHLSLR